MSKLTLYALVLACTLFTLARPAAAYVVEAMTSIPAAEAEDATKLETAVRIAVDQVATHAVAFAPTVVSLRDAKIVGDRIYLFILLADADGEAELAALKSDRTRLGAYGH
jgi:hypothetical protein